MLLLSVLYDETVVSYPDVFREFFLYIGVASHLMTEMCEIGAARLQLPYHGERLLK